MRRRLPAGVQDVYRRRLQLSRADRGRRAGLFPCAAGIFDPLAAAAAHAVGQLGEGDVPGFRATLDPTVPLARLIFRAPTQYYKTGVVFLAWLNGFQDHFVMLNGAQSMRPLPYFCEVFRLADGCGLLREPAIGRGPDANACWRSTAWRDARFLRRSLGAGAEHRDARATISTATAPAGRPSG